MAKNVISIPRCAAARVAPLRHLRYDGCHNARNSALAVTVPLLRGAALRWAETRN